MPNLGIDLKTVQLLPATEGGSLDGLGPKKQLAAISKVADGIGPWIGQLVDPESTPESIRETSLVRQAHKAGLQVHPYTFRSEAADLPGYVPDYPSLIHLFRDQVGIDGYFTDAPDQTRAALTR